MRVLENGPFIESTLAVPGNEPWPRRELRAFGHTSASGVESAHRWVTGSGWVVAGVAGEGDGRGGDWPAEVFEDGVDCVGFVDVGDDSTFCTAGTGENFVEAQPADEGGPVAGAGAWRQESFAGARSPTDDGCHRGVVGGRLEDDVGGRVLLLLK